jgi:Oxysterol-binding protein
LGNSIDVFPVGRTRIRLDAFGEVYALYPPQSRVHNILVGRTWVDHLGEMTIENMTTGMVCDLVFNECGWFGAGRYAVSGTLFGSDEVPRFAIEGAWNKSLSYAPCDAAGGVADDAAWTELWTAVPPLAEDPFGFTAFAHSLNRAETAPPDMMASDARLRADRQALETGERLKAGAAKHALEEQQRAERRQREELGVAWMPRWFRVSQDADNNEEVDTDIWEFTGAYDQRPPPLGTAPPKLEEMTFAPWQFST